MFISGFNAYVDALGRGAVVLIKEAEEISEGFDLAIAGFG